MPKNSKVVEYKIKRMNTHKYGAYESEGYYESVEEFLEQNPQLNIPFVRYVRLLGTARVRENFPVA